MAETKQDAAGAAEESQKPPVPAPVKPAAAPGASGKPAAAGSASSGKGDGNAPTFAPTPGVEWMAGLREITSTAIAGAVVLVAMLMLWRTFAAANNLGDMKDVMLYGLSILGSVIGFYFGRVPAERRAEAAEANRDQAQATALNAQETATTAQHQAADHSRDKEDAQKKLALAKAGIEKAKTELRPPAARPAGERGGLLSGESGQAAPPTPAAMEVYLELEALSRIL